MTRTPIPTFSLLPGDTVIANSGRPKTIAERHANLHHVDVVYTDGTGDTFPDWYAPLLVG